MCIIFVVLLKVSVFLFIFWVVFWGYFDVGDFFGCWGNKMCLFNKDLIYKGCKIKILIIFELECGSLFWCVKYQFCECLIVSRLGWGLGCLCVWVCFIDVFWGGRFFWWVFIIFVQDRMLVKIQVIGGQVKIFYLKFCLELFFFLVVFFCQNF